MTGDLSNVTRFGLWLIDRAGDVLDGARNAVAGLRCVITGHRRMTFLGDTMCTRCWRTWE